MKHLLFTLFFAVICAAFARGQQIYIDENFADWAEIEPLFEDDPGKNSGLGLSVFKITNDSSYLYFYLEMVSEILFQQDNNLSLFIDSDNNKSTGFSIHNIGAEFEYQFGARQGTFYGSQTSTFGAYQIGLVSAPTVSSPVFEFKLNRNSSINGQALFPSDTIAVMVKSADDSDIIPGADSSSVYVFKADLKFVPTRYQMVKKQLGDLRVLSYNVLRDNLFASRLRNSYQRILQAIKPDIIGFQEVYNFSGADAAQLMEDFLPSAVGEQWFSGDTGSDNLVVSRYPVIQQQALGGNSAYLLDLGDRTLMMIVAHTPCCSNNSGRQDEIDAFMAFLRDSQNSAGFNIAYGSPILIVGDMNLVGLSEQQRTLLTGDIKNENTYGNDFDPDWDGSALNDARPANTELPTSFTWYDTGSSFSPGRLDYIVYSGSVLELVNSFSLFTPALPADTLSAHLLEKDDTLLASDHLPVVSDFRLKVLTANNMEGGQPTDFHLFQNYPNPFNPTTTIDYQLSETAAVTLEVFSLSGQKIATLIYHKVQSAGSYHVIFDAAQLPSGVYLYRLQAGLGTLFNKMVLIK